MSAHAVDNEMSRYERLLIIDDHPLFCEALSMTLQNVVDVKRITSTHTLADALGVIEDGLNPDTIILDLNLPDVNNIEGLLRLRDALPGTPVVVISSINDNRVISQVMQAGAVGFIPKDTDGQELECAFKSIRNGGTYTPATYSSSETLETTVDVTDNAITYINSLTPQQRRILDLVCEGKQNKQIAHHFAIAETTVKAHITAILRKLQVNNRTQAVLIAQQVRFKSSISPSETFS